MTEQDRTEYRRLRALARTAFSNLVDGLNRRDTLDGELNRSRHPLPAPRIEYLTAESILAHKRCEHLQSELDTYGARLRGLARELGLDEFDDDERGGGARSSGLQRTGDVGPATRAPRGSADDAPRLTQLGLL